jgi:formamidopyrimidine-DNA glycosylase
MPEVAEVERLTQTLRREWLGKNLTLTTVQFPRQIKHGDYSKLDSKVLQMWRRAKFILTRFESGTIWCQHLGHTGWWDRPSNSCLQENLISGSPDLKFTNPKIIRMRVKAGDEEWVLYDQRTWSRHYIFDKGDEIYPLKPIGVDILDMVNNAWGFEKFLEFSQRRKCAVYRFLTAQNQFSGLGNYMTAETLQRAHLSPFRKVPTLTQREMTTLWTSLVDVVRQAMRAPDYEWWNVFFREGKPCGECGAPVCRRSIKTRSIYYCEKCQSVTREELEAPV